MLRDIETLVESGDMGDIVVWGDNGADTRKQLNSGSFTTGKKAICKTYGR